MAETLNDFIQQIRHLIRKARTSAVDGLYLDEAGDIQDRLLRLDATCLEMLARIDHVVLEGVIDNPHPPARFNGQHQRSRRAGDVPQRREMPERHLTYSEGMQMGHHEPMEPHLGHQTRQGENPNGEAHDQSR